MTPKRIGPHPNNSQPVRHLPPTLTVAEAADMLGVSRSTGYDLVAAAMSGDLDKWPVPVLKVGGRLRVPTKPVLDRLGLDAPQAVWLRSLFIETSRDAS
jgi:predicted DNA-binding transcriptional regulator AlpA